MPPAPGLGGNTLRQALRVSIGGTRLRVHFSNEYGSAPLAIRSAYVARYAGWGVIDSASSRALSFSGRAGVTLPVGGTGVSDAVDFALEPLADVAITLTFGAVPAELTGHPGSFTISYLASGWAATARTLATSAIAFHWYVITGIDVVDPSGSAVAIVGNSITDGVGSTYNANDRWTDILSRRLRADPTVAAIGVLNQGIGGNCVLRACAGPSALDRFLRDVVRQSGVKSVIIFEGVNDLAGAAPGGRDAVARALITGYQQLIGAAHRSGIRIHGATITPFGGSGVYTPEREAARQTVNGWIRSSGEFDAVIDFDAAVRDPADPTRFRPDADSGDHIHPGAGGNRMMGEAVDLALFR